ncbi:MAG TPA: autotransporter outer membrane beta-barrel domain-containing protein [Steroidobacteraceae bacterium]|nr:autotransporter outer membrane beta-barrel domain-containing protein [Steroidobacteraceae bacterium]
MNKFSMLRPATAIVSALAFVSLPALAQTQSPAGPLEAVSQDPRYNFSQIEKLISRTVDSAYSDLSIYCSDGCATDSQDNLIDRLEDLQDAAFDILFGQQSVGNDGIGEALGLQKKSPRAFSANDKALAPVDDTALRLRDVLRAVAPEEFSGQRSANTEFASNQLSAVSGRMDALRFGASGFSVAGLVTPASPHGVLGGAAASSGDVSKWGGFLNGSYTFGDREKTQYEGEFDYDGFDITFGADYRVSSALVLGATASYLDQSVEFGPTPSQPTGVLDSKGFGIHLFGLYEWDGPYTSAALGYQMLSHDSQRQIAYQLVDQFGFNIGPPVNETETGDTDSNMLTGTLDFGWPLRAGSFGYEPYVRVEYRKMTIDGFTERSVDNLLGGEGAFGVTLGERDVESTVGAAGMKASFVFTPSFGVVIPYLKAEYRNEFHDDALQTSAVYTGLSGVPQSANSSFGLPSDPPDTSYYLAALGGSIVLKGGWQGFIQAQRAFDLDYVTYQTIAVGVRGEF